MRGVMGLPWRSKNCPPSRGYQGHLAISQEDHIPGVPQDGGNIRSYVHLTVALADNDTAGIAQAGGHDAVRLVRAEEDKGTCSLETWEGILHGGEQVLPGVKITGHHMDDNLCIGLGSEFYAVRLHLAA